MKYIDKSPPTVTGDSRKDAQAIVDYLAYLREQFNFMLAQTAKDNRKG